MSVKALLEVKAFFGFSSLLPSIFPFRWMKLKMGEMIAMDKVFLDSDNLSDLTTLFQIVGFETQCIVILLTRETLYRISSTAGGIFGRNSARSLK